MNTPRWRRATFVVWPAMLVVLPEAGPTSAPDASGEQEEGRVRCANLTYDRNKTSVCFADRFLRILASETGIPTDERFHPVRLASDQIYDYPFAVMTGEGRFQLTEDQRKNLRNYLQRGGFLLASAGCSSPEWDRCFRGEIRRIFPDHRIQRLALSHPVFHTVFDIERLEIKKGPSGHLEGMEINGKLVLIYSQLGLNDTANAGKGCCCCGGSEILNAPAVNANILAYALTH